jgi:hypothetical protein
MTEPHVVHATRSFVARRLGLELDAVQLKERSVPDSDEDEPMFATLVIADNGTLSDDTIDAAVVEVDALRWQHPAYPLQLRWERKA